MKIFLFVFTTLLIVLFQNCSKEISVQDLSANPIGLGEIENVDHTEEDGSVGAQPVDPNQAGPGNPNVPGSGGEMPGISNPPGYVELKTDCEKAVLENRLKKRLLPVSFPNPKRECDWGANGNYDQENGLIRARREQVKNLSLEMGTKVCSLKMHSVQQDKFFYDDNIFLTLNGFVLASTSDFSRHLESRNGFYLYNWLRLRNKEAQNRKEETELQDQFCAGAKNGLASCSFPQTETYGSVNLSFQDEVFQKIFAMTRADQVSLGLVTTGDDDGATDCQHVDINFDVEVSFIE